MSDMIHDDYKIGRMGADEYELGRMGSDEYKIAPTQAPTHGVWAALYRFRKNGFKGSGLNDATWGTGFNGSASAYFEVVIDAEGASDTFKWRKNGGSWTAGVAITGAAQTLSDGQTITFAATTGHTENDQWSIGNFKTEPCDESGIEARITDEDLRLLNPNAPPTFTDSGGKAVTVIDFTRGKATFNGAVVSVTVTGNNGFVLEAGLEQIGYLIGWQMNISVDMADASRCQQRWKQCLPGEATGNGSANAYFLGEKSFLADLKNAADGSLKYVLLQLFTYDPENDQTGNHFLCWATITGIGVNSPLNEIVKEQVNFQITGIPSYV